MYRCQTSLLKCGVVRGLEEAWGTWRPRRVIAAERRADDQLSVVIHNACNAPGNVQSYALVLQLTCLGRQRATRRTTRQLWRMNALNGPTSSRTCIWPSAMEVAGSGTGSACMCEAPSRCLSTGSASLPATNCVVLGLSPPRKTRLL